MIRMSLAVLGVAAATAWTIPTASADTIFDVEHARGNARAGGPVSGHDAELLNRWGALSGTPGWRHRYREFEDTDDYDRRRVRSYRWRDHND